MPLKDAKNKTDLNMGNTTHFVNGTTTPLPPAEKLTEVHIDQHKTIRITKEDLNDLLDLYMGKIVQNAVTIKDQENEINQLQSKDQGENEILKRFQNLTEVCQNQTVIFEKNLKNKNVKIESLELKLKIYEARLRRKQHALSELRKHNESHMLLIEHLKLKLIHLERKFREKKDDLLADWESATTTCIPYGKTSGIHLIQLPNYLPFLVHCEGLTPAGPGWTVIQRRFDGSIDFYRNWKQYAKGFGKLNREFFLGLEKLHWLTNSQPHELYIIIKRFNGDWSYAHYDNFLIGNETEGFELQLLGHYEGNASDALRTHDKMKFSTFDRDNDEFIHMNCAVHHHGAWWYDFCSRSNLNGKYFKEEVDSAQSIYWEPWYSFKSLKSVQMQIRPKSLKELEIK
ncbi:uncharacterized protein Dwil_GK19440 [Drosophila willistoni]|uniref:Fibrinogen C-terminal domain-containing protein n=1 Tax=Drosophila willistoni TaxID=7260 RepID=B4MP73_DROWI|nr:fibrinogen-like protein 1 [Drosophila willistoni]EDW73912.2 uncharacterized protein Dwil_GK19440 [Drosophila willistoni]